MRYTIKNRKLSHNLTRGSQDINQNCTYVDVEKEPKLDYSAILARNRILRPHTADVRGNKSIKAQRKLSESYGYVNKSKASTPGKIVFRNESEPKHW